MKMIKNGATSVNAVRWILLLIVLAGVAVWGVTLTFGFVWDDIPTVVTNPSLSAWGTLWRAFVSDFWGLHEQPAVSGYWRPVPTLLYLLTGQIFGKSAWAFHALNLGFHVAVG
ncbi:MAG: hypothetical protein V1798_06995, partial [Pseudomonadota bacterium]